MFSDARSKKIVLVSHCILNQNSISDGTADYPGTNESILKLLVESKVGIIQMPCPEILCLGLDRGDIHGGEREVIVENTRIRSHLEKSSSADIIKSLTSQIVFQIQEYIRNEFNVLGLIGVNRSPSCGVDTSSKNNLEVEGEGVFIEMLRKELKKKNININMVGVKGLEVDQALATVQKLIDVK